MLFYLLGLISVVLCALFLPNDRLGGSRETEEHTEGASFLRQRKK